MALCSMSSYILFVFVILKSCIEIVTEIDPRRSTRMARSERFQRHSSETTARARTPAVLADTEPAGASAGPGRGQAALQPGAGAAERVWGECSAAPRAY